MESLQKTANELIKNNMEAHVANSRVNVVPLLKTIMPLNISVGSGGSVTLSECGVLDFLRGKDFTFYERVAGLGPEEIKEIFKKQHNADVYFSSSNAITESGELYNVDGNANRVAAIAHGPKRVIIIAGKNKIVKDLNSAVMRVKTIAAPKNCVRLGYQTPCFQTGRCISLEKKNPGATDGCASDNRICCHYLITGFQKVKNRICVILINENLGL